MKTISVLEFRRRAKAILESVKKGQRILLTYRGEPIARLEPIVKETVPSDDPFYSLAELAIPLGEPLDNETIDRVIYGP